MKFRSLVALTALAVAATLTACGQDSTKAAEEAKKAAAEAAESRGIPEWLEVDAKGLKGKFKALPQRAELPQNINEHLVIELYSK